MTRGESIPAAGPDYRNEEEARGAGAWPVAGVDEAGRGPLAGPVVAAAVIFHAGIPDGIDDSKKLAAPVRERLCAEIMACAHVGVGIATVEHIDRDNILQATLWAMARAIAALPLAPGHVLVDGNRLPALPCPATALVAGDCRSLSIAAASIVAKATRDRMMIELAGAHPGYGWEHNMGYSTAEHCAAIARLGVTVHHRRSFAPVREALLALTSG
jgi:ribonuclease HII